MKRKKNLLRRAKEILQIEKLGLEEVSKNLDSSFAQALELILTLRESGSYRSREKWNYRKKIQHAFLYRNTSFFFTRLKLFTET
jgi:hypothetical protein